MARYSVDSSNVRSIGYNPRAHTLEVEFLNGSVYQYYGVPEHLHHGIMRAPSKGRFLHNYIKNSYPYSRVG